MGFVHCLQRVSRQRILGLARVEWDDHLTFLCIGKLFEYRLTPGYSALYV